MDLKRDNWNLRKIQKKKKKLAKKIKGCEILNVPFTFQLLFYWLRPVARVGELSVQIKNKKREKENLPRKLLQVLTGRETNVAA